jgi:ABC-type uncharacterized transport system substrate-binding protein
MTKDEFDDREDLYEHLLKEVTALCECGSSADIIVHALIRNAVELAVVCTENTAEARATLTRVAALVNPTNPATETTVQDVEAAARAMGLQMQVLNASTSREIDAAFASFGRERPDAVFVSLDVFLNSRRAQLVNLASRHYSNRDFPEIGGLMSYGTNIADAFRQIGLYTGRILKGAKPADLPIQQPTKFEFVINLKTAKALGLEVPAGVSAMADEVIE